MSAERLRILQMIEEQKITAAQGMELLQALDETEAEPKKALVSKEKKFLRVRVTTDKAKVNVNIPLSLVRVASKFAVFGMGFIPEEARKELDNKGIDLSQLDLAELMNLIEQGVMTEKLVDIEADDPKEGPSKVEVYVD